MANDNADTPYSFDSGHQDLIHDVQVDFYGKTLASASSDKCIRIFEIVKDSHQLIETLTGHTGPVWKLSWAHPKFDGIFLASCGYDKRVIIWRQSGKKWMKEMVDTNFSSSVNTVEFSPSTPTNNTLELIAGCGDGTIKVYTLHNKKWSISHIKKDAHPGGVNAISWATPLSIVTSVNDDSKKQSVREYKRFVSGGCDNIVRIWRFEYQTNEYHPVTALSRHGDWVRDVAWAPIPSSTSHSVVASCSEDKTVIIWKESNKKWVPAQTIHFDGKVWSVSWSELGNILAVALGANSVQLYKEGNDGQWQNISNVD